MLNRFKTSTEAFEYLYCLVLHFGENFDNTKALFNIGIKLENPCENEIKTKWRKWSKSYAQYEWEWYLSKNRSVAEIKKRAPLWDKMHSGDNLVWSNYGWQWNRNDQINYVINELKRNKESRKACISIYDGKEHENYKFDTPCTLSIHFQIIDNKLNMTVNMRSNDLIYGFCNDQYCFSNLLKLIANELRIETGWYYHFCSNLHIYNHQLKLHLNDN